MRNFRIASILSATVLAVVLTACGKEPQTESMPSSTSEVSVSERSSNERFGTAVSTSKPAHQDARVQTQKELHLSSHITLPASAHDPMNRFEGLDPRDISQAEIDELIALQKEQVELRNEFQEKYTAWSQQNRASRGKPPQMNESERFESVMARVQELSQKASIATMRKEYKSFDPKDISKAEIDELITLQNAQIERQTEFQKEYMAWSQQDSTTRGVQPQMQPPPRLQELNAKVQMASMRKQYEKIDSQFISESEIDELLRLQQEQSARQLEVQAKYQAWQNEDPATRGAQPDFNQPLETNSRLQVLLMRVQGAQQVNQLKQRVEWLSQKHNISLSDSEISQLSALQIEQQKLQAEYQKILMEWSQQLSARNSNSSIVYDAADFGNRPPPNPRSLEIAKQIRDIQAPLVAAEAAENTRKQLTQLSEQYGVTLLSGEIEETINLNAEKTRLQNKYQQSMTAGYGMAGYGIEVQRNGFNATSNLPSDEDYARLKEIEARLKVISAPMTEAQNAAQDAANPRAKQQRLEQEKRQKWAEEWQDRKQAGEVPWNAPMHSPSYAELQDSSENFREQLKKHADEGGFYVSEINAQRLESIQNDMLAIRKTVHELETGGQAMVEQENGGMTPSFGVAAGMFKIKLLQTKQTKVGLELAGPEKILEQVNQNGSGVPNAMMLKIITDSLKTKSGQAEILIEGFRARGIEVSQSDADDLLDFERDFIDEE